MQFLRVLRQFKLLPGLAVVFLAAGSGLAASAKGDTAPSQAATASTAAAPNQSGSQYVGAQTCQGCHDELYKSFMASPHSLTTKETRMTHGAHGCESCHGPGSAHVEGGGDKSKIFRFTEARPEEISKRCLSCHEASVEQRQFLRSVHNENGITCTNCHSIHHTKAEYLLTSKQQTLCFSCHQEQRVDFQKPFRHRVLEGMIRCSDCHNPHGTTSGRQIRTTPGQEVELICYKCHMDKRGPFVFEHNAVRTEGCLVCHSPHGSTNARMLITARVNSLCLQCHAAPSGPHNQSGKAQDCILCHSQIHGSNLSDVFFK
jgi:DmsE family decaheme c-type cytochrome